MDYLQIRRKDKLENKVQVFMENQKIIFPLKDPIDHKANVIYKGT